MKIKGRIYYLASPYSHKSKSIMDKRHKLVNLTAALLKSKGFNILCPITMSVPIGNILNQHSFANWEETDLLMIDRSDGIILCDHMEGWTESIGVTAELEHCRCLGKPIYLCSNLIREVNA